MSKFFFLLIIFVVNLYLISNPEHIKRTLEMIGKNQEETIEYLLSIIFVTSSVQVRTLFVKECPGGGVEGVLYEHRTKKVPTKPNVGAHKCQILTGLSVNFGYILCCS